MLFGYGKLVDSRAVSRLSIKCREGGAECGDARVEWRGLSCAYFCQYVDAMYKRASSFLVVVKENLVCKPISCYYVYIVCICSASNV